MSWIDSRAYADKITKVLTDNRVLPAEWKYHIPIYIVQQPLTVVMNAKWLADGINEAIELYHPNIEIDTMPLDKYMQEVLF